MTASKLQDDAELVADNFQTELEGQFMKIGAKDSEDALSVLGHKLQLAEQAVATLKANQAAHKKQDEEASGGVANALEAKQESVTKMNSIQEMELQAVALANTRTALAEKQLSEARSRKTAEFTAMAVEENAAEAAIEAAAHAAIAKQHAHTMHDFNKMNQVYQRAKDAITAAEAELEEIESQQEAPIATAKMHVKEMSEHLKSLKAKVLDLKEQIAHIEKNRNGQLRLQRTAQANLRDAERRSRTKIPSGAKLNKLEKMQRKQKMSLISASTHAGEVKFKVFEKRNAEAAAAAEMLSQKAGAMKKSAEAEAQKAAAAANLKTVELQVSHAKAKLLQTGIDAAKDKKLEEAREAGFELAESQKMVAAEDSLKDKRLSKEAALKAEAASSSEVDELSKEVQKLELKDQAAGTSREVQQEEHRVTKDSELLDEAEQLLRDRKAAIRQLREQMAGGGDGGVLHQMEDAKLAHTAEAAVSSTSAELQKDNDECSNYSRQ